MKEVLLLCAKSGIENPDITRLKGDLSERIIYRVKHISGSFIAVTNENIPENEAFLSFRDTFEENGFNVPAFIAASADRSVYFIEDLGDETVKAYCDERIRQNDPDAVKSVYKRIISELPRIQTTLYGKIDYSKCYQSEVFDRYYMEKDIERFEEYFLKQNHKNYDPVLFFKYKNEIISAADSQGKEYFIYRDFQTRNIMMKDDELYFIDFQSGRKGSFYYDPASFIYSSNTVKYEGMENEMSRFYYDLHHPEGTEFKDFERDIKIFGCLRIMQAVGNYAFYFYSRKDIHMIEKANSGLNTINDLSRNLNIETGIYEG